MGTLIESVVPTEEYVPHTTHKPRVAMFEHRDGPWYYVLVRDDYIIDACTVVYGPFNRIPGEKTGAEIQISYYSFLDNEVNYDELSDDVKVFIWELSLS